MTYTASGCVCLVIIVSALLQSCVTDEHSTSVLTDQRPLLSESEQRLTTVGLGQPLHTNSGSEYALDALLTQGPLSEESAIQVALRENRRLRAHYQTLGIAQGQLLQAGLLRKPVIDAPITFFSSGTEFEGGLFHPIIDVFRRPLKEAVASHHLEAERVGACIEILQLIFDVKRAYLQLSVARADLELQRSVHQTMNGIAELNRILHDAGNTTPLVMATSDLAAAQSRLDLSGRQSTVIEWEEEITRLLGLYGKHASASYASIPLTGPLPTPLLTTQSPGLEERVIMNSLQLQRGRAEAESLSQRLALEGVRGSVPDMHVGANVMRESDGAVGAGPALELELPIFDHGQGEVMIANARLSRLLIMNEDLAVNLRSNARRLRDRLTMMSDRSQYYDEYVVRKAVEVTARVLEDYNAMQISAMKFLEAKARELSVRRGALMARKEAMIAHLDLLALLSGIDVGKLSVPSLGNAAMDSGSETGDH